MPSIFVLYFLLKFSAGLVVKPVDVRRVDYCKLPCKQGKELIANSACNCRRNPDFVEELHDMITFRTNIIKWHNQLRNKIAGGSLEYNDDKKFPKAANMRALSYSLQMEYIARCHAVKIHDYHDKCRRSVEYEHCGQNLGFTSNPYTNPWVEMTAWWEEYPKYDPDWIGSFQAQNAHAYGHFTQVIWALDYEVGCAKSFCPTKNKSAYQWAMLCNYAGGYANSQGQPVYLEGEPCSQCPEGTKCNEKYPNLCGEIDPIPKDPPVPIFLEGEDAPEDWNATTKATGNARMNYFNKISLVVGVVLYIV